MADLPSTPQAGADRLCRYDDSRDSPMHFAVRAVNPVRAPHQAPACGSGAALPVPTHPTHSTQPNPTLQELVNILLRNEDGTINEDGAPAQPSRILGPPALCAAAAASAEGEAEASRAGPTAVLGHATQAARCPCAHAFPHTRWAQVHTRPACRIARATSRKCRTATSRRVRGAAAGRGCTHAKASVVLNRQAAD